MTGRWSVESVREATGVPSCPKHEEPLRDRWAVDQDGVSRGELAFYCESCEAGKPPVVKAKVGTAKLIQCFCFGCGETFAAEAIRRFCRKPACDATRRAEREAKARERHRLEWRDRSA